MSSSVSNPQSPKSVKRTIEILETFTFDCPRQRVIDIASKLGMTQSTVSRHLGTLIDVGLLERDSETGYYSLGFAFVKYAGIVFIGSQLYRYAYPELRALHEQTGLRAYLGVLHDNRYMCVANAGHQTPTDSFTPIGYTYPLHSTAIGKVLLAYMSEPKLHNALQRDRLASYQANTITDIDKLKASLKRIRQLGYATIDDESLPGISSVAAPIFNSERTVEGVISVSDSTELINLEARERELAKIVKHAASNISKKLGFYPLKL